MSQSSHREVSLKRIAPGKYQAVNADGATLELGQTDDVFSPVEVLLAAIGACSAIDVDTVTSRKTEPESFDVTIGGEYQEDDEGRHKMEDINLDFHLQFPDTDEGRHAASLVSRLVKLSHDKDCTVGRTVLLPTSLTSSVDGEPVA